MSEDYRGDAELTLGTRSLTLPVRLSARFEPLEGRLRWAGRTAPDPSLMEAFQAGERTAKLAIAGGSPVTVRLGEPDPWGGLRLTGDGFPPWPDFG